MVILNKNDYFDEEDKILYNTDYFQTLQINPSAEFFDLHLHLIKEDLESNILTKKEYDFLNIKYPKMPIFYYLKKVHKDPIKPPGRPKIAGINSLTSNLSQYIDRQLQKYVSDLKSYLKYTISRMQAV